MAGTAVKLHNRIITFFLLKLRDVILLLSLQHSIKGILKPTVKLHCHNSIYQHLF